MKPIKKFLSLLLSTSIIISVIAIYSTSADAVVTTKDGDYEYTFSDNGWCLYSYSGNATDITLPQSFSGTPVKSVFKQCFKSSNLHSITIPSGYTSIGEYAFYNCENLTEVILPDSITEIANGAFSNSAITNIDLHDVNINKINDYVFKDCKSLASVFLPDSITFIGEESFSGSALCDIRIPDNVTSLGNGTFKNTSSLVSITVPKGLKTIGDSCFENSSVSKIELPETLETIGESAFKNANSLSELYIPNSVYSIGAYALYPMSVQSKIHVLCFKNSYADEYCYENFVQNTTTYNYVIGDADLNGKRNISDATIIQKFKAGLLTVNNPCAKLLMDTNFDGKISIRDATLIQMRIADIITEFIH